jgi:hypothetical protein
MLMVTLEAMGFKLDAATLESGEPELVRLWMFCGPSGDWHGWRIFHSPQSEDIDLLSAHQGMSSF